MKMNESRRIILQAVGTAFILSCVSAFADKPKNIIVMISDGQGFNTIRATDYYTGAQGVYESFDVKFGMQTSSANNPAGYNPASMASNFNYAKSGATDSSSAATAMFSGVKVYDGRINWSTSDKPLTTFFEVAAKNGKGIGAVTGVEISHATPACVYAHNSSRDNFAAIANEGIYGNYNGNLKVLMGSGHGDYDNNGNYKPSVTDNYVGGTATLNDMKDGSVNGFTFVDTKGGFESLATGATPDKVIGIARANETLQQKRNNPTGNFDTKLTTVPTLETMTAAALNVLDNDTDGFALMIEGGAVDWANHSNQLDRMIEEQIDFNNSVQKVVDWVNANSNWTETLLIVTADHETGYLWGATGSYALIGNNGVGNLPTAVYNSGGHSNSLVPFFAKGAGSELFANYVVGTDGNLRTRYGLDSSWSGQYIDNTAIYNVAMTIVPEPATLALLGLGLLMFGRKK